MKKIEVVLLTSLISWSCVKNEELTPVTQIMPPAIVSDIQESFSAFSSRFHPTSGTVKVVADKTCAKKIPLFRKF